MDAQPPGEDSYRWHKGHRLPLTAVALSPDDRHAFTAGKVDPFHVGSTRGRNDNRILTIYHTLGQCDHSVRHRDGGAAGICAARLAAIGERSESQGGGGSCLGLLRRRAPPREWRPRQVGAWEQRSLVSPHPDAGQSWPLTVRVLVALLHYCRCDCMTFVSFKVRRRGKSPLRTAARLRATHPWEDGALVRLRCERHLLFGISGCFEKKFPHPYPAA